MLESAALGIEQQRYQIDKDRAKSVIEKALAGREARTGFFATNFQPEKQFIEIAQEYGTQTENEAFCLNALFMTTPFVIAQNTGQFFNRITDAKLLNDYAWIFDPSTAINETTSDPNGVLRKACLDYFRPAGYSVNALGQWMHNLSVLNEKHQGDIRNFFRECEDDAVKVVDALVVRPRAKSSEKTGFRRYGPKLARLFVQWVNQYELYVLKNSGEVGVPVDFQIARVLIQTDAIPLSEPVQAHTITHKVLLPMFTELCNENGFKPQEVSEALWTIGSVGCSNRRHEDCPVASLCNRMISRNPYDRGGMFDPTDVGRFKKQ